MKTKTVLLVEDDVTLAEMVAEYLASRGLEVLRASTARGGLEALAQDPDLVLTDRQLPDDDGELLVLRRSKADKPDRPVVVMSGRHNGKIVQAVLKSGADEFLPKPFDLVDLQGLIQKHLGEKSPQAPAVTAEEVFGFVEWAELDFDTTDWNRYEDVLGRLSLSLQKDAGVPRGGVVPPSTPIGQESLKLFEEFKKLVEQKHSALQATATA